MSSIITYAEAGKSLHAAIKNSSTGFIARVNIRPGQAETAIKLADCRRVLARMHVAGRSADYLKASLVENDYERAQAAAERRAMLAELLILDVLREARVPFESQPLVDYSPAPGCDLKVAGMLFDVKAASQMSSSWSYQCVRGKYQDDRQINVTRDKHANYCANTNFAGYICVYIYIEHDEPVAADIFVFDRDEMGRVYAAACGMIGNRDYSYYALKLPFPDSRHSDDYDMRRLHVEPVAAEELEVFA